MGRQSVVTALPSRVRSFLKDFESLDVRRAKALLQPILKAAAVDREGTVKPGKNRAALPPKSLLVAALEILVRSLMYPTSCGHFADGCR